MITFPPLAEQVIEERVKNLLGLKKEDALGANEYKKLALKVRELSDYFTKRQDDRPDYYLGDRSLMAAYMAYFVPSNLAKVEIPLAELFLHPHVKSDTHELSFLDLGSGPGTASAGFINYFFRFIGRQGGIKSLSITVADRVKENLSEARLFLQELWKRYEASSEGEREYHFNLDAVRLDLHHLKGDSFGGRQFDFVVMSNSLVETEGGDEGLESRLAMIEFIARHYLKEKGSLIIIEPALRDASRDLLLLRDEIIKKRELNIYSPCLDPGLCEALVNVKDWCHEGYGWQPPGIVEEIDKRTAFEKSGLKFSYLLVRKDGLSLGDLIKEGENEVFRVVSDLMVMKGEKRVFLCGMSGRVQLGRLNRHKSEDNEAFDSIRRGDLITIDGLHRKGSLLRIDSESRVRPVSFHETG